MWIRLPLLASKAFQLKKLTELGCTEIQGYYLGRPMSVELFNREFMNNDGCEKSV